MQLVTPRQFCRIYFGLDGLPEESIEKAEKAFGYKKKCSIALAKVLNMSPLTLINTRYGQGIDFEGLSAQSRLTLTLWVIERQNQEKISHLEERIRFLESQIQYRQAV